MFANTVKRADTCGTTALFGDILKGTGEGDYSQWAELEAAHIASGKKKTTQVGDHTLTHSVASGFFFSTVRGLEEA